MKKISKWASLNAKKAQAIIVVGHLLNTLIALSLGLALYLFDVRLPGWLMVVSGVAIFAGFVLYPERKIKTGVFKHTYAKQKTLDFLLVFSTALLFTTYVNHFAFEPIENESLTYEQQLEVPAATFVVLGANHVEKSEVLAQPKTKRAQIKDLRKQIKSKIKEMKQVPKEQRNKGGIIALKVFLILLIVIAMMALAYLVAILACALACSGAGAGAILALFFGYLGITAVGVFGIVKIAKAKMGRSIE